MAANIHAFTAAGEQRGDYGEDSRVTGERIQNSDKAPHEQRRGKLKNGNPSGDYMKAPRCGAKNRRGTPCQCPAMPNGRCRLHGGKSTGPKTEDGLWDAREAVTQHGRYSKARKESNKRIRAMMREASAWLRANVRKPKPLYVWQSPSGEYFEVEKRKGKWVIKQPMDTQADTD